MSAMAALNVFSIVFGVATMIPFLGSMLPQREDLVTTVRIYAGTGDGTDGQAPNVAAWDIDGTLIGSVKGGDLVVKGAPFDSKIEMKAKGNGNGAAAQAHYISLSQRGNDAICIAGISVTWPDGIEYAWYGDVGELCGAPWYHSSTILSAQDLYTPKCVWIDGDETNGIKTKGMAIHLPSFVATEERAQSMTDDKDLWCKVQPRLHFYDDLDREQPVPYFEPHAEFEPVTLLDKDPAGLKDPSRWKTNDNGWKDPTPPPQQQPNNGGGEPGKGQPNINPPNIKEPKINPPNINPPNLPRQATGGRFKGHLIKSSHKSHSAKELCESSTSMGPDFVSIEEGFFCDMDAKKAWPLCNAEITNGCFDVQKNQMVGGKINSRRDDKTGERIVRKRYERVDEW
jgi:hypothetical protein